MWRARRLFVEIAPNTVGLVHISEIELDRPSGVIQEWDAGDSIDVKVISVRLHPAHSHSPPAASAVAGMLS